MECPICFENTSISKLAILSCSHKFHQICIYKWSILENSCPICREKFNFDTDNQKDFLNWLDFKLENFQKYHLQRDKLKCLIEIVNTTIRLYKKDIKCSSNLYKAMSDKLKEYKRELKISLCRWLYNLIFEENHICEYRWYEINTEILDYLSS